MRGPDAEQDHLLEVGVRWPPETFIAWKLEGLAAQGMRVTVASRNVFDRDARLRGVELLELPARPTGRPEAMRVVARSGLGLLLRSPRRLARLVRVAASDRSAPARARYGGLIGLLAMCLPLAGLRPDVVHFEWHSSAVDHLPLYEVWGCAITTSSRGSDISVYPHLPGSELYARSLPEVFSRVSGVHFVCRSLVREAAEFGLDPAKARVARPAIDPELFQPAEDDGAATPSPGAQALRLVMVGWLRWEKGYEYALEAVRRLRDDGVPVALEIVGDVPPERRDALDERARILHTVGALGLEDEVTLRGAASSADIARTLRASDVLMHPSVTEGIPVAVTEAMACELPVVVTDCGGLTEAVSNGVEGIVVPPRDPEALRAVLDRLWWDAGLRRRLGRAGRERVLSEFTLSDEHEVYVRMYRDAIHGR